MAGCLTRAGADAVGPMEPLGRVAFRGGSLTTAAATPHRGSKRVAVLAGQGRAFFSSHLWCGKRLRIVIIRHHAAGGLAAETRTHSTVACRTRVTIRLKGLASLQTGWWWHDYFSIPQPRAPLAESDQHVDPTTGTGKAIARTPTNAALSTLFIVFALAREHSDQVWASTEYTIWDCVVRVLPFPQRHLLKASSGEILYQVSSKVYSLDFSGEANFLVKDDEIKVAPVGDIMRNDRLRPSEEMIDIATCTYSCAHAASVLQSTRATCPLQACWRGGAAGGMVRRSIGLPAACPYGRRDGGLAAVDRRLRTPPGVHDLGQRATACGGEAEATPGNVSVVEQPLSLKAEVDAHDAQRNQPFTAAAVGGSVQPEELLVTRTDIEAGRESGASPLDLTVMCLHLPPAPASGGPRKSTGHLCHPGGHRQPRAGAPLRGARCCQRPRRGPDGRRDLRVLAALSGPPLHSGPASARALPHFHVAGDVL